MADPQVGSSRSGNNSNAQPINNGQAPAQPKALPLVFNFVAQNVYNVDLSVQQQFNTIDFVQAVFVDNSVGTAPIVMTCNVTRQSLIIPPKSQAYLPFLQTVPIQFTISSTGGQTAALVELLNFPVAAMVWSVANSALSFNGAGALQVSDTLLEALIANGGLGVSTLLGANYVIFEGQRNTYSVGVAAANISAAGTFMQLQGAAFPTVTKLRRARVFGHSATAADTAFIALTLRTSATGAGGTFPPIGQNNSNGPGPGGSVKSITAPSAPGTFLWTHATGEIALPLVTNNVGNNTVEFTSGALNDQSWNVHNNINYLCLDLVTASGAYANNAIGWSVEWTEE